MGILSRRSHTEGDGRALRRRIEVVVVEDMRLPVAFLVGPNVNAAVLQWAVTLQPYFTLVH